MVFIDLYFGGCILVFVLIIWIGDGWLMIQIVNNVWGVNYWYFVILVRFSSSIGKDSFVGISFGL